MFDLDRFIADCREAIAQDSSHKSVREVVARAVADHASVIKALGEPTKAGLVPLYRSPELTILNLSWGPLMTLQPHDHRMWACIGIYGGREDNIFWRRIEEAAAGTASRRPGRRRSAPGIARCWGRTSSIR